MDAQQFLTEFRHLASAPNSIKSLRTMIFSLAATGDLVINENFVDAQPLIASIREQKLAHPDLNRIVQPQKDVSTDEIRAPQHWARCRIGDLVLTITGGGTPSKSNPAYWNGDIPWASVKDLKDSKFLDQTEDFITSEGLANSSTNLIPSGRIIVSTRMGLGKLAINRIATAINQDLKALELPKEVNIDFFYILYRTKIIKGTGTTVEGIRQEKLLALPAALPPIEEQKRIVTKVDELMLLCDKLEMQQEEREGACALTYLKTLDALRFAKTDEDLGVAWRRLNNEFNLLNDRPESLSNLKKLIFDMAVKGKLSTLFEGDTLIAETLSVIDSARTQASSGRSRSKMRLDESITKVNTPFEIPSHWQWVRLERIACLVEYGTSEKAHNDSRGIPVLRMGNLSEGKIDYSNLKYVNADIEELPRLFLNTKDLLFNRTNSYDLVGKMSVFEGDIGTFTFASYLIRVTLFNQWVNPHYVNMYFQSTLCRTLQIEPNITIQTNQANFNGTKLKSVLIPLPPIEEQDRIIGIVNRLTSLCDLLEQRFEILNTMRSELVSVSVAAITGIRIEEKKKMKVPKCDLVCNLRIGVSPTSREQAPLATILVRNRGELSAKALWGTSGMDIDGFYQQLKIEMANGWIVQPEIAYMKELETA